jgi:tetratricopeptide (TPR) repeat protein
MADRIGGSFPDDRAARPSRPADRGSFAGGDRRSSGDRDRGRGPSGGGSYERRDDQRDDRRGSVGVPPTIPDSITDDQLSRDVRDELGGLPYDLATLVGRYLVAAEIATDPEQAYRYAQAARTRAARIGVVREVAGITAYQTGRWAEALAELRAARRLTGRGEYLPLMADAERALGRLDRALELVHSDEAKRLPRAAQIELRIVESGIRRDQGLADASVLALQVPELTDGKQRPWSARLFYAYGDALLAAARPEAAREAFSRAVVADEDEQTDALARLDELDGITVKDLEDDADWDEDSDSDDADLDDEADLDEDDEEEDDLDDELDDGFEEDGDEDDEEDGDEDLEALQDDEVDDDLKVLDGDEGEDDEDEDDEDFDDDDEIEPRALIAETDHEPEPTGRTTPEESKDTPPSA